MIYSAFRAPLRPSLRTAQDRIADELKLGPELIVNGSPLAAGGWTVTGADTTHLATFANGKLRYQSDTTSPQLNVLQNVATVGKRYLVVAVVSAAAGGSIKTDLGAPLGTFTSVGTYRYTITATNVTFNLTRASAGVDITIDKISVREILL